MLEKTKLMKLKDKVQLLEADHPDILDEDNEFPSGTDLTLNGTGDLEMSVDVGGNSTQIQYEGYNKFNINQFNLSNTRVVAYGSNFVTINFETQYAGIGHTSNSLENKIYSFKGKLTGGRFEFRYYLNGTQVGNPEILTNSTSFKKIDNSNGLYDEVQITVSNGTTIGQITFSDMILVEGEYTSDTMPNWEPYVGNQASPNPTYKQDINNVEGNVVVKGKSKNLATTDKDIILAKSTSGSVTLVDFGKDVTFDEMTFSLFFDNAIFTSNGNFCNLKKNDETNQFVNRSFFKNKNNELATTNTLLNGRYSYTTTNVTFRKLIFFTHDNSYVFWTQGKFNALLEASSTPTDTFIPHAENTVTFPLSQGQKLMLGDTLEDDGIHHKRGQVVLDGSENWSLITEYTNNIRYDCTSILGKPNGSVKSNYFIEGTAGTDTTNIDLHGGNGRLIITAPKTIATILTEFKSWLAQQYANGTPVIVEYELETEPTEPTEPYTSAQQTAYNKLKEMQSYYDLTYVVGSSDNAQPILTAHAKKSIKVMNDEISNLINRVTILED